MYWLKIFLVFFSLSRNVPPLQSILSSEVEIVLMYVVISTLQIGVCVYILILIVIVLLISIQLYYSEPIVLIYWCFQN